MESTPRSRRSDGLPRRIVNRLLPAVFGLLGCAAPTPVVPAYAMSATPTLTVRDGSIEVDGRTIPFPTSVARLEAIFGPFERRTDSWGDVYVWSEPGFAARLGAESSEVRRMELLCARDGAPPDPVVPPFRGRIGVAGGFLGADTTPAQLAALGLVTSGDLFGRGESWGGRLGHTIIVVKPGDDALRVSLSHMKRLLHPASDGTPFTVRAREHGCDFDEDLVELRRDGNTSVVRLDSYGLRSRGVVGRSMFLCGAFAALAIERGYRYSVQLDTLDRQAEAPAGGGSSWLLVGFTNEAHPDFAREFPGHAEEGLGYQTILSDWALLVLGDWPELIGAPTP